MRTAGSFYASSSPSALNFLYGKSDAISTASEEQHCDLAGSCIMGAQALANRQQCRPSLEGTKSVWRWEGGLGTREPEHPWVRSFSGHVLA